MRYVLNLQCQLAKYITAQPFKIEVRQNTGQTLNIEQKFAAKAYYQSIEATGRRNRVLNEFILTLNQY